MTFAEALTFFSLSTLIGQDEDKLRKIYHRLAQKYHPDKGGNQEDFIKLRQAFALLKKQLNNPDYTKSDNLQPNTNQYNSQKQTDKSTFNSRSGYRSKYSKSNIDFTDELYEELQRYKSAFREAINTVEAYEEIFNSQIRILNANNAKINQLIEDNNQRRLKERSLLEEKVKILRKAVEPNWRRFILGAKHMPESEYISRYNRIIEEFNQQSSQKESEFINALVEMYSQNSKQIFDSLNKY